MSRGLKSSSRCSRLGNFKNKFLQSLGVLKSIIDGFIESFNMEETFEVFHIFHKEIKEILTVSPVSEQQGEFIRFLILNFYSPEMVESVDYPYKLKNLSECKFTKIIRKKCNL